MNHEAMNHETMNHETMNHETMNHEAMNHETMNHETMNHETMNHETMILLWEIHNMVREMVGKEPVPFPFPTRKEPKKVGKDATKQG